VVSNAGGPGILAADACEKTSLHMARLTPATIQKLQALLPPYASVYNPVDIIGDAGAERFRKSLETVLDDPLVHAVLLLLSPTAMVELEATTTAVAHVARRSDKPVHRLPHGQDPRGGGPAHPARRRGAVLCLP